MQTPLRFYLFFNAPPGQAKKKKKKKEQADTKADSDHTVNEYLIYLDIHLKQLNQAALCGRRARLIENKGRAR